MKRTLPRGNVRFMVEIGHNDFFSFSQDLRNRQTDQADKRSGIHAERYLGGFARVQKRGDALPCLLDRGVHFLTLAVAAATLNIAKHKVIAHSIKHGLRDLRTRAIVEKYEVISAIQGWKLLPQPNDGETRGCHV